jgi:4-hydroxybenzoate polyprenyltransferase
MVAAIQYLIYQRLLTAASVFHIQDFILLCFITVVIAASGYIINDYYDARIDRINRPDRWIAGNTLSLPIVWNAYIFLIVAGAVMAILLAYRLALWPYLFIYPLAVFGLWVYSYRLKCTPVAGNIWVALFCAGVVVAVAAPDWLLGNRVVIHRELWYYAAFAFLATWYREVVKDLEDVEGDQRDACQTYVVRYGLPSGRIMAIVLGVLLLAAMYSWDLTHTDNTLKLIFTVLQGAIVASMAFVWWAKNNSYYHNASLIVKLVMLGATLVLLIL